MTNCVNKANLHPTNLIAHPMVRPRLDEKLEQATDRKLVYVIAGAGYGIIIFFLAEAIFDPYMNFFAHVLSFVRYG